MASESTASAASKASGYIDATQAIRSTVRWLLTAAAGIGGVLVAGLQLTSLGALSVKDDWPRLIAAVAGLAVALVGVGYTIFRTSKVLTDEWITLAQVSDTEFQATLATKDPQKFKIITGLMDELRLYKYEMYAHVAESIPALYAKLIDSTDELRAKAQDQPSARSQQIARSMLRPTWTSRLQSFRRTKHERSAEDLAKSTATIREAVDRVVGYANYYYTRARFTELRKALAWSGAAIATGVLVFAYAANPPKPETPPASATPASASPASPTPPR
jgi:hypothetical protein